MTAVLLRMSRLDAFDRNAEAKPPDRELGEIEQAIGTGEGNAVVGADRERQASLTEQSFEGRAGEVFAGRLQSFAQEQETRGMVCDGQRVAVPPVAELELAFEVGAPQVIGHGALGQRRAARAVARRSEEHTSELQSHLNLVCR